MVVVVVGWVMMEQNVLLVTGELNIIYNIVNGNLSINCASLYNYQQKSSQVVIFQIRGTISSPWPLRR